MFDVISILFNKLLESITLLSSILFKFVLIILLKLLMFDVKLFELSFILSFNSIVIKSLIFATKSKF